MSCGTVVKLVAFVTPALLRARLLRFGQQLRPGSHFHPVFTCQFRNRCLVCQAVRWMSGYSTIKSLPLVKRSEISFGDFRTAIRLTGTWSDRVNMADLRFHINFTKGKAKFQNGKSWRVRTVLILMLTMLCSYVAMGNPTPYNPATSPSSSSLVSSLTPKSSLSFFSLHSLPYSLLSPKTLTTMNPNIAAPTSPFSKFP